MAKDVASTIVQMQLLGPLPKAALATPVADLSSALQDTNPGLLAAAMMKMHTELRQQQMETQHNPEQNSPSFTPSAPKTPGRGR